jgi:hypothetical protein
VLLANRLKNTRDNLYNVCDELGQEVPEEGSLPVAQCVNCSIWLPKTQMRLEDNLPICSFCSDIDALRF